MTNYVYYLSLPEDCSLLETAKSDVEQAQWISLIPMFLGELDGHHPSILSQPCPDVSQLPHPSIQRYYSPYFKPLWKIWDEYIILCEKYPGLEKRFCDPSTKNWLWLNWLLPVAKVTLNGEARDLPWMAIGFNTISLIENGEIGYHPQEVVFEIAAYLNHVSVHDLYVRFAENSALYDSYNRRQYVSYYKKLQGFYNISAEHGEAVLVSRTN